LGLLCTDVVHDYIRSELRPLDQVVPAHAEAIFRALEDRATNELREEGLDPRVARHERELDMRYTGQGYELRVPLADVGHRGLTSAGLRAARAAFDQLHARIHGHAAAERPVEIVSYRLRIRVPAPKYRPVAARSIRARAAPKAARKGKRMVYFEARSGAETLIFERDRLPPGARLNGPAIVEQFDATTVIPPSWKAAVDGWGNLVLTRKATNRG
jgi:N-methylhydantoinase A